MEDSSSSADFQEWEVLHNLEANSSEDADKLREFEEFDGDSGSVIRSDYFSLQYPETTVSDEKQDDEKEEDSVESDNPSWIDPAPLPQEYPLGNASEFWSDSGSDPSDSRNLSHIDCNKDAENSKPLLDSGIIGGPGVEKHKFDRFWSDASQGFHLHFKNDLGTGDLEEITSDNGSMGKMPSDSRGIKSISTEFEGSLEKEFVEFAERQERSELSGEEEDGNGGSGSEAVQGDDGDGNTDKNVTATEEDKSSGKSGEEKKRVVWWKVPVELFKYCVLRVSPVWSFSVAAAVMGIVILGRRLYKMRRKTQGLRLKVTLDDKKVSQFMSHAAKLNEAFSVVRRVPTVRPSLPAPGVSPWPVMTLR